MPRPSFAFYPSLVLVALAGAACSGAGGPARAAVAPAATAGRVAADSLPPCTAEVAGAALQGWRELSGPGFRACIPGTWTVAASRDTAGVAGQRWRGEGRAFEWRAGPFGPGRGMAVPFNQREVKEHWFDSRPGKIEILGIQAHQSMYATYAATARAPALRFSASATGAEARAELLTVFQTLQGPAQP